MSDYHLMQAGGRVDGCTCEMVSAPVWDHDYGPEPAEWEQDPLCWVHPSEPGTWWDPIQSSTPEWRAFMERDRSVESGEF